MLEQLLSLWPYTGDDIILVGRLLNWFASFVLTLCFCNCYALSLTLKYILPLKLRKASEDCKHRLPLWCGRIDVILKRDEGHLLFLKLINDEEEIQM